MDIEGIRYLAARIAALLPSAPADGESLDWISWRELVWDAARRLADLAGDTLDDLDLALDFELSASQVSSTEILGLAVLFRGQGQLQPERPAF